MQTTISTTTSQSSKNSCTPWHGLVVENSLEPMTTQKVHKAALQILTGALRSANLERLHGNELLCARANGADRILFKTVTIKGKAYLAFIEHLGNHRYDKSKYIPNPEALRKREEEIIRSNPNPITIEQLEGIHSQNADTSSYKIDVTVMTHYQNKYIALDAKQEEVIGSPFPAVITGPAGSGKSCIAFKLILDRIQQAPQEPKKILYITSNAKLAESMQQNWNSSPDKPQDYQAQVTFIDYETFVLTYKDIKKEQLLNESDFKGWFAKDQAIKNLKKKMTSPALKELIKPEIFYQELDFIALSNNWESYKELGKKRSITKDEGLQKAIFDCHERYQNYLKKHNLFDLRLYPFGTNDLSYSEVYVDEAQDMSRVQLTILSKLAEENNHCFCLDTNQSLQKNIPIRPFLVELLTNLLPPGCEPYQYNLETSYRNAPAIISTANLILKIKNRVLEGVNDKSEYASYDKAEEGEGIPGNVELINIRDKKQIDALKELTAQTNCVVVIDSEDKRKEAIELYGTHLVFTVDQIVGLEREKIILHKMMGNKIFTEITNQIPDDFNEAEVKTNRPKNQSNERLAQTLHRLFTAVTRAQRECYLVEDHKSMPRKLREILTNKLKSIHIEPDTQVEEEPKKATREDWIRAAREMIERGLMKQAIGIMQDNLQIDTGKNPDQATLLALLNGQVKPKPEKNREIETAENGASTTSSSSSSTSTQPAKESPKKIKPQTNKPTKTETKTAPSKPLSPEEKYIEGFLKNIKGNLNALLRHKNYERIIFEWKYQGQTLFQRFCKDPDLLLNNGILIVTNPAVAIDLLHRIINQKHETLSKKIEKYFLEDSSENPLGTSCLFAFANSIPGHSFLLKLFEKNKNILRIIQSEISKNSSFSVSIYANIILVKIRTPQELRKCKLINTIFSKHQIKIMTNNTPEILYKYICHMLSKRKSNNLTLSPFFYDHLKVAADWGSHEAEFFLYELYLNAEDNEALHYLERAANGGIVEAQYQWGNFLGLTKGRSWLEKAADQGHSRAQLKLGVFLLRKAYDDIGDDQNVDWNCTKKGLEYLKNAAVNNEPEAYTFLGAYYLKENNPEFDPSLSVTYLEKGSELGNRESTYLLGVRYLRGVGVDENPEKAFKTFLKSADQDCAEAFDAVAECYEKGIGVEKNPEEAARWKKMFDERNKTEETN